MLQCYTVYINIYAYILHTVYTFWRWRASASVWWAYKCAAAHANGTGRNILYSAVEQQQLGLTCGSLSPKEFWWGPPLA